MKVLVIGGTGLISTGIVKALLEKKHTVTLFNRGVSEAILPQECKVLHGDRRKDYGAFESRMREGEMYDAVIDMVCMNPEDAESMVRAFSKRTSQVIFCSTVDVYTQPAKKYPIEESSLRVVPPEFTYGCRKVTCENTFDKAQECGAFAVTHIRPAYTYGEGRFINHWLENSPKYYLDRLRKGKPIIVHGNGTTLNVVCHRDDAGVAFANAVGNTAAYGKGYNVSGDEYLTWDQLHQEAAVALGAPAPTLVYIPTAILVKLLTQRPADAMRWNNHHNKIFDNTAAKRDLGFRYTITWREGVKRVAAWLDARGMNENCDAFPQYDRILDAWNRVSEKFVQECTDSK